MGEDYSFLPTACNSFQFTNLTDDTSMFIRIYEVSIENYTSFNIPINYLVGSFDENLEILPGDTYEITWPNDGAFTLEVYDGVETLLYVYHSFCNIRNCYQSIIINNLCNDSCCDGCADKDYYNLNKFNSLYNLYFSYVDVQYKYSDIINGALDNSKLQELFEIDLVRKRIEKLCSILADCGCTETLNTSDCGC